MIEILDGKKVRDEIAAKLKGEASKLKKKPCLVIIQVGDLSESNAYIGQKILFAERIGVKCDHVRFTSSVSDKALINRIKALNADKNINGIIVQMPIPPKLNKEKIIEAIDPGKDVDGLHSENIKKLWEGKKDGFAPATAKGVVTMLEHYHVPMKGRKAVVVGRSFLVGKPVAGLLLNKDATITIAHRYSEDLSSITKEADILVVATGVPNLIGRKHVKKGQVIIDVGINVIVGTPKLVGDVDFKAVSKIVRAISPVPGGVGPMTVASLFENVMDAYKRQNAKIK